MKESVRRIKIALSECEYPTVRAILAVDEDDYPELIASVYQYMMVWCNKPENFNELKYRLVGNGIEIDEDWIDACFYRAVMSRDINEMRECLEDGADVHAWNDAAIRLAAEIGDNVLVNELLAMGANVAANDHQALNAAVRNENLVMVCTITEALVNKSNQCKTSLT